MCNYQRELLNKEREQLLEESHIIKNKIDSYGPNASLNQSARINLHYEQKKQEKVGKRWKIVEKQLNEIVDEEIRIDRNLHPQKAKRQDKNDKTKTLSDKLKRK